MLSWKVSLSICRDINHRSRVLQGQKVKKCNFFHDPKDLLNRYLLWANAEAKSRASSEWILADDKFSTFMWVLDMRAIARELSTSGCNGISLRTTAVMRGSLLATFRITSCTISAVLRRLYLIFQHILLVHEILVSSFSSGSLVRRLWTQGAWSYEINQQCCFKVWKYSRTWSSHFFYLVNASWVSIGRVIKWISCQQENRSRWSSRTPDMRDPMNQTLLKKELTLLTSR